jgi:hypothetical protein
MLTLVLTDSDIADSTTATYSIVPESRANRGIETVVNRRLHSLTFGAGLLGLPQCSRHALLLVARAAAR